MIFMVEKSPSSSYAHELVVMAGKYFSKVGKGFHSHEQFLDTFSALSLTQIMNLLLSPRQSMPSHDETLTWSQN